MTQIPKHRGCPRPAPRNTFPTNLGHLIARHAGPLSIDLLRRDFQTDGQVSALSRAIQNRDDPQSRAVALSLARMDPGHPDAVRLLALLDARSPEALR